MEIRGGKIHLQQQPLAGARPEDAVSAANLMRLTEGLALRFPNRIFGTDQGEQSARWVADQMKALGLKPLGDDFLQHFAWPVGDQMWPGHNVAGVLEGSDPQLKHEYVIVAAHHDSQEDTHQGANDNATGCAAVLAIAQALAKNPPKRSVVFMTFDGEEGLRFQGKYQAGRRGSKHYADNPLVPLAKTAMLVNLDMIGQVHLESGKRSDIFQWASRDSFAQGVLQRASEKTLRPQEKAHEGYPEQHDQAQMFSTDAEPLYRLGVPTVNFLSGRDLDNHHPNDAMPRVIPERMAQYGRLALQVTLEAANKPESLAAQGIQPGGLMPTYPLIRATKSAGTKVVDEETRRLTDLEARLPQIKGAAKQLVQQLSQAAQASGLDFEALAQVHGGLLTEGTLNAIREAKGAAVAEYRELDKNQLAERKAALPRLSALSGAEDVLAGALYLTKIEKGGAYYLQQIPDNLGSLLRGARRLGLQAGLEGIVAKNDIRAYSTQVSADRAVSMARELLSGLGEAVGTAALALLNPNQAALEERPVRKAELDALAHELETLAAQMVGAVELGPKDSLFARAMLQAQLGGLKGSDDKLLEKFAAKNVYTDFVAMTMQLDLPEAAQKPLVERAKLLKAAFPQPSAAVVVDYYRALTTALFGPQGAIQSVAGLKELAKPEQVEAKLAQRQHDLRQGATEVVLNQNADDPQLAARRGLVGMLSASLELQALFDPKRGGLLPNVSLERVQGALDQVKGAAAAMGAQGVHAEVDYWRQWLTPFLPLEAPARLQAADREKLAKRGLALAEPLWPKLAATLKVGLSAEALASPQAAHKALQEMAALAKAAKVRNPLVEHGLARTTLALDLIQGFAALTQQASPSALDRVASATQNVAFILDEATSATFLPLVKGLQELESLDRIAVGKKDRGGPVGVLSARLAQKRGMG